MVMMLMMTCNCEGYKSLYFVNYHLLGSPQLLRDGVDNLSRVPVSAVDRLRLCRNPS